MSNTMYMAGVARDEGFIAQLDPATGSLTGFISFSDSLHRSGRGRAITYFNGYLVVAAEVYSTGSGGTGAGIGFFTTSLELGRFVVLSGMSCEAIDVETDGQYLYTLFYDDRDGLYAVAKMSSPTSYVWLIGISDAIALAMAVYNGYVYIAGAVGSGRHDAFIAKIYPGGGVVWSKVLSGPENAYYRDIAVDAHGNIYGVGVTNESGTYDFFVAKITGNGSLVYARVMRGDGGDEIFPKITIDDNGYIYVAGGTYTYTPDTKTDHYSAILLRISGGEPTVMYWKTGGYGNTTFHDPGYTYTDTSITPQPITPNLLDYTDHIQVTERTIATNTMHLIHYDIADENPPQQPQHSPPPGTRNGNNSL